MGAENAGQLTKAAPPPQINLPEAVTGGIKPLDKKRVVMSIGINMRHTITVYQNLCRLFQTCKGVTTGRDVLDRGKCWHWLRQREQTPGSRKQPTHASRLIADECLQTKPGRPELRRVELERGELEHSELEHSELEHSELEHSELEHGHPDWVAVANSNLSSRPPAPAAYNQSRTRDQTLVDQPMDKRLIKPKQSPGYSRIDAI